MAWSVTYRFEELGIPVNGIENVAYFNGSCELEKDRDDFVISYIEIDGDNGSVEITKHDHMWLWVALISKLYASDHVREFYHARAMEIAA